MIASRFTHKNKSTAMSEVHTFDPCRVKSQKVDQCTLSFVEGPRSHCSVIHFWRRLLCLVDVGPFPSAPGLNPTTNMPATEGPVSPVPSAPGLKPATKMAAAEGPVATTRSLCNSSNFPAAEVALGMIMVLLILMLTSVLLAWMCYYKKRNKTSRYNIKALCH